MNQVFKMFLAQQNKFNLSLKNRIWVIYFKTLAKLNLINWIKADLGESK